MKVKRKKYRRARISDNLFAYCDLSDGPASCWPFLRSRDKDGYGTVAVIGRQERAHRLSYMQNVGEIPEGLCVLHSCDNPPCCNPKHLRVGSQYDNARDREERGRGNQNKGEACGSAKLTAKDVMFIRRCWDIYNTKEMAQLLGVSDTAVAKVLRQENWSWVPSELFRPHVEVDM